MITLSQRVDQRQETLVSLATYQKLLKLSQHTYNVCKVKENKSNRKHIIKRQLKTGQQLIDIVNEIGAYILEANNIYVGSNLDKEYLAYNYKRRIKLEDNAKSLTFRMEHLIRVLNFNRPFADSTITYWVKLLVETRQLLSKWRDSEVKKLNEI